MTFAVFHVFIQFLQCIPNSLDENPEFGPIWSTSPNVVRSLDAFHDLDGCKFGGNIFLHLVYNPGGVFPVSIMSN